MSLETRYFRWWSRSRGQSPNRQKSPNILYLLAKIELPCYSFQTTCPQSLYRITSLHEKTDWLWSNSRNRTKNPHQNLQTNLFAHTYRKLKHGPLLYLQKAFKKLKLMVLDFWHSHRKSYSLKNQKIRPLYALLRVRWIKLRQRLAGKKFKVKLTSGVWRE